MDKTPSAELGIIPEQTVSNKLHKVIEEMRARAKSNPETFFNYGRTTTYVKRQFNGREIDWPVTETDPYKRRCYNFLTGVYPMRYLPNKPETQAVIDTFISRGRQEHLENLESKLPHIRNYVGGGNYFFHIESKDAKFDAFSSLQQGRIYINPLPQQTHRVFWKLSELMNAHPEIPFQLKMLNPGRVGGITALDLNRADKMVIYFNLRPKISPEF